LSILRRYCVLFSFLCACISAGCQAANTPEGIVTAFMRALDAGQYDKAATFFADKYVKESEKTKILERVKKKMTKYALEMQENGGLDRVQLIAQKTSGSDTLIQIKIITKNAAEDTVPTTDFYMIMEDGNWKIQKTGALRFK